MKYSNYGEYKREILWPQVQISPSTLLAFECLHRLPDSIMITLEKLGKSIRCYMNLYKHEFVQAWILYIISGRMCLICYVLIHSNIHWYSSPNVSHVSHSILLYGQRARPLPLQLFSNLCFINLNLYKNLAIYMSACLCFFTLTRRKY